MDEADDLRRVLVSENDVGELHIELLPGLLKYCDAGETGRTVHRAVGFCPTNNLTIILQKGTK
jgi:hypothetical protein